MIDNSIHRIAIFGMPGYGHINPLIPLIKRLRKEKYEVHYFINDKFKSTVENAGAIFHQIPLDNTITAGSHEDIKLYETLPKLHNGIKEIYSIHLNTIKDLDPVIVLADIMAIWGKDIAIALKIPFITLQTTIVMNRHVILKYGGIKMASSLSSCFKRNTLEQVQAVISFIKDYKSSQMQIGLTKDLNKISKQESNQNLVFIPKLLQPAIETLDDNFHFTGSSIEVEKTEHLNLFKSQKPLIYVSLGTVVNNKFSFYQNVIEVLRNTENNVIISCGKNINPDDFSPLPNNIKVQQFVDQKQVLSEADLFITHGGMNSTLESTHFGVPMLFYPSQGEQRIIAKRIEELGGGILINDSEPSPSDLYRYIQRILNDTSYKTNTNLIKKHFSSLNSLDEVVSIIAKSQLKTGSL